jgi:transposase
MLIANQIRRLSRAPKLNPNVLNRWHKEFLEQAPSIFEQGEAGSE